MGNGGGLGVFAGSFADAFTRVSAQHAETKRRDDFAKQQSKLVEMALKNSQNKLTAQTTLADIMTGNSVQEFEQAPPIQTPGGRDIPQFTNPGQEPLSFLEIMSGKSPIAIEGQQAALQSGAISGGDVLDFKTQQDQLAARQNVGDIFNNMPVDEGGNPMMIAGSITIDPVRGPVQTLVRNPDFNTARQADFSRQSILQLTDEAFEIMDIETELSGSLLESGFPFGGEARTGQSALATVGGALGFNTKAQKDSVAKRDRVGKLYGQILGIRMRRMADSGETITNDKLAFLQSISPDTNKSAPANALLLADFLQEELNNADIEGTRMPAEDRNKALDFIRKARSGGFSQESEPVVDAPGIASGAAESFGRFKDFTMDQIQSINVPDLPTADIPAFRARFDQLKTQAVSVTSPLVQKAKSGLATARDFAGMGIDEVQQIKIEDVEGWTAEQIAALKERVDQILPSIPSGDQVKHAALVALARKLAEKEQERREQNGDN